MARKAGRKPPRFTSKAISQFLDEIQDADMYLVGWTLVPPNMMLGGRNVFLPVDALDCAGFKGRGQGTSPLPTPAHTHTRTHAHPITS